MADAPAKLIVLDDEPNVLVLCQRILGSTGYDVTVVSQPDEALQLIRQDGFDLLLTDIRLPGTDGFEVMRAASAINPQMAIVVITGYGTLDLAVRALREGAFGLVTKPLSSNQELVTAVQLALERKRILRENLRLKALLPLFEVSQFLQTEFRPSTLYDRILDVVSHETSADQASLMLMDEEARVLYIAAARGLDSEVVQTTRQPIGEGIAGWVAMRNRPLLLSEQGDAKSALRDAMRRKNIASALSVPLTIHGRVIGVLNASSCDARHHFNDGDLELLTILAGQVAIALDNMRMYVAERQRGEQFRLLNEIYRNLLARVDLKQIALAVLAGLPRLFDVEACALLWREGDSEELPCLHAIRGETPATTPDHVFIGQGVTGWVVLHGEAVMTDNARADPRFYALFDDWQAVKMQSVLCVPLSAQQQTLGAIALINKQGGRFVNHDLELLNALAASVSLAMDNARLIENVKQSEAKYRELLENAGEAILLLSHDSLRILEANAQAEALIGASRAELQSATLGDLLPSAHTHLIQHVSQMSALDSAKYDDVNIRRRDGSEVPVAFSARWVRLGAELILQLIVRDMSHLRQMERQLIQSEKLAATGRLAASIAHEINNPLQAIQNSLALVLDRPLSEDKRKNFLLMANQEVERLISIAQRMLDFYRPSAEARTPCDIHAVLEDVCLLADKRLQHGSVTLNRQYAPYLPTIEAIPNQLKQVFLNLVLNAIEAMPQSGVLSIVTRVEGDEWLAVEFADRGEGISASELPRIFEPFYSTKEQGTGLGLAVSYNIVERHGGRIDVKSELGRGSTFIVRLPLNT